MKKEIFTLTFMLLLGANLFEQDLVFKMTEDSGVEIVNDARFDIVNKCIGNTKEGTTIRLGEVDFADGNRYAGCSVEIAHENKAMEGYLDFYLGNPDNGGVLINDVQVNGTGAFQYYRTFRYNFYPEGGDVVRPTGKGDVYVRYRECEGNLKKVVFYTEELSDSDMGEMKDPVYQYQSLLAKNAEIIEKADSDPHLNDEGAIGWTGEGVVVKFADVDFKDGNTYQQIAVVSTHGGGTNPSGFLMLYIDDVNNEDNLVAKIWTARDFYWTMYGTLAKNITKKISGKHDLYVKWTAATNLKEVQLIEGTPWEVEDDEPEEIELIDEKLTESAYTMTFDAMGGVENPAEIIAVGTDGDGARFEGSNIGYTSRGVVVKLIGVDFKDGMFKRILVQHSSDQAKINNSSFDFYLDLPFSNEEFADLSILEGQPILASVVAQGTNNWSDPKRTGADMSETVTGIHDLYMVFQIESGCNVFEVSLDVPAGASALEKNTVGDIVNVSADKGMISIDATQALEMSIYNMCGQVVEKAFITNGTSTFSQPQGMYILKFVTEKGESVTTKVIVK